MRETAHDDKPMADTLTDVLEIFRLAKGADVPVFSSSSLRYAKSTQAVRAGSIGRVTHAIASSPAKVEEHHPDLFLYGVHGCEALFTVMGTRCESVIRRQTPDGLIEVEGTWAGGRTGIFREGKGYSGNAKGEKGESPIRNLDGYEPLVAEIVKFFKTGKAPIPAEETIELFAFMEAADESKRRGGKTVRISEVLEKAKPSLTRTAHPFPGGPLLKMLMSERPNSLQTVRRRRCSRQGSRGS